MKINKILCIPFVIAACCFLAGTVNHIVNTHEGWLSSLLLAGGCLCGVVVFYKKKQTNSKLIGVIIMKTSSKTLFILSITWIIVSLLWFLWVKNTAIGVIWLCMGIIELIIAFISKKKEQNK